MRIGRCVNPCRSGVRSNAASELGPSTFQTSRDGEQNEEACCGQRGARPKEVISACCARAPEAEHQRPRLHNLFPVLREKHFLRPQRLRSGRKRESGRCCGSDRMPTPEGPRPRCSRALSERPGIRGRRRYGTCGGGARCRSPGHRSQPRRGGGGAGNAANAVTWRGRHLPAHAAADIRRPSKRHHGSERPREARVFARPRDTGWVMPSAP
mmetsp:Transcript_106588/g.306614  ORF Transcript_106588/g.306614 Transcript_106588/m.306614 type:complete len:211 (+) Transcript_106588:3454-4086(+)